MKSAPDTIDADKRFLFKVALIGNYVPDRQESMERFTGLMADGLRRRGHEVRVLRPQEVLKEAGGPFFSKWIGHLNKYLLFPRQLRKHAQWADITHICDHSNAVYISQIGEMPHLITCHDLLAVRAALGEETFCSPSVTGKILQHWILRGLRRAKMIACDSTATKRDVERLIAPFSSGRVAMIPLGLNYPYRVLTDEDALVRLRSIPNLNSEERFLLHVGSSERRKNREGVLRIFSLIQESFRGQLVFAGAVLQPSLLKQAEDLGVLERIVVVERPDNASLEALYNRAFALLFPSLSEGFGWPIIEAQACGCPVIASSSGPCPEVIGSGGIVHDVQDERGFADSLLALVDTEHRDLTVARGFKNLQKFDSERMVASYEQLYREVLKGKCRN